MNPQFRPLPVDFTQGGFDFKQLKRIGQVALFAKYRPGHSRPSFEVIVVQRHPAETLFGREYPARESMPPSESWGTLGWTHVELSGAENAFRALVGFRQESALQPADTPGDALCADQPAERAEGGVA